MFGSIRVIVCVRELYPNCTRPLSNPTIYTYTLLHDWLPDWFNDTLVFFFRLPACADKKILHHVLSTQYLFSTSNDQSKAITRDVRCNNRVSGYLMRGGGGALDRHCACLKSPLSEDHMCLGTFFFKMAQRVYNINQWSYQW